MPRFLNPFSPGSRDTATNPADVVIPLESAVRVDDKTDRPKSDTESYNDTVAPGTAWTMEALKQSVMADAAVSGIDDIYDRKSKIINKALQDIGMGRYQWELFALCGFGWFADNLWLQGLATVLTSIQREFSVPDSKIGYTTTALFIGLCLGATIWGVLSDVIGRRPAFNITLALAGIFGIAAGAAPNWIGTAALFACLGTGVGGNLPVDGALFLEFLPGASGGLLTLLSIWWPVGQLIASLIGWGFIPSRSCTAEMADAGDCTKEENMGWRYSIYTYGAITFGMFLARFFLFHLYESPKFHLSHGREDLAVAAVHGIAKKNKTKTWLTLEVLHEASGDTSSRTLSSISSNEKGSSGASTVAPRKNGIMEVLKSHASEFSLDRLRPLFATKKLALSTSLIWFCWLTIGMGYPLFNAFLPLYLTKADPNKPPKSNDIVYRNYAIISAVGVPGSIIAYYTVDLPYIGRRGTMLISTILSGIFLFLFTLRTTDDYQLTFSSLESFFQNMMYGVLYAYTPEVFPAPNRGTGTGVASLLNRVAGLCAPIIATNTVGGDPRVPVWVAGGLILAAGVSMAGLPIETRGREKL